MPYPFPDPAVTPEFEAANGIIYQWDGQKWVVKNFAGAADLLTQSQANAEYVRQDGTSNMSGNLNFLGNRAIQGVDGSLKLDAVGIIEFAKHGSPKLTINTDNITIDTNLSSNFGIDALNIFVNHKPVATQDYVQNYALAKSGNITISGTTTLSNANPLVFSHGGSQAVDIKTQLLFYGLKADNLRPSWEACKISNDPNNENFSAFFTGKRFYWSGTYAYLNGSLRNYLDTYTWDFRDNSDNIILSIDKTKVEYNGTISSNKSVATKEYVDTAINTGPTLTWSFFNSSSTGTNTGLDGLWVVEYVVTPTQGQIIIKAKNDTANVTDGTVVCQMPANTRPATSMAVIRLTSRDGETTADAVFSNQTGDITVKNVQGPGSNRLEGLLIYPIHAG